MHCCNRLWCITEGADELTPIAIKLRLSSKLFFGQCIFLTVVIITILETTWNIGFLGEIWYFLLLIFSQFFKIRTSILTKLGHYLAFCWQFYGAMHPSWLLMSPRKFWKKNEIFQKLWNFEFSKFFKFVFCLIRIEEPENNWIG